MLPERKRRRLPEYDYGQNGAYFVTICTADRRHIFWRPYKIPFDDHWTDEAVGFQSCRMSGLAKGIL